MIDLKELSPEQRQRCAMRLANDVTAFEKAIRGSDRIYLEKTGFGGMVIAVRMVFPGIRMMFQDLETREVEIHPARVDAWINFTAGQNPYPFDHPGIKIQVERPGKEFIPFSGGYMDYEKAMAELTGVTGRDSLPQGIPDANAGTRSLGTVCICRAWNPNYDLFFIAFQIHKAFANPDYAPNDCLNREAALFYSQNRHLFPLEAPIPEITSDWASTPAQKSVGLVLKRVGS